MDTTESEDYLQAFLAGDFGFNPSTESGDFLRSHERDKLAAARDIALKNARRAYASLRAQLQSADAVRRLEVEEARHERDSLWQDKFRITEAQCEKVKRELQLRNVMNAELTSENIEFLGDKRRRSEELWAAAAPVAKHGYYKDEKSLLRGLRQALDERQKPNLEASGTEAAPWRNVIKEHGELQKQCADMQRRYEEEKMEKQTALDTLEKNAAELHDVRETVGELTREITNHDDAWGLMLKLADTEMEKLRDKLAVHETHKQELRSEVAQLRVPTAHSTDTHPDERAPSSSSHFSHEAPHTALVLPSEKTLRASHDSLRNLRSPRNLQPPQAAARGGSASSHRSAASVGSHRSAWSFALSPRATEKDVPWEQSLRSPIGSSRASSVSCKVQGKDRARSHSSPRALRPSDVSQRSARSHSPSRRKLLGSERPRALAGQKRPSSKAAVRPSIARKTGESPRSSDPQVMQRQWAKHHRALSRLREQEQTRRTIIATLTVEEKRLRAEIDSLTNIHAASVGDVTEVLRIQMWELEQRQRAAQANGVGGQEEGHEAQLQLRAEIAFLKADNARLTERAISVEGDTEARARAARADNTLGRKDTLAVRTAPLANGGRCESVQRYEVMLEKQNAALRRDKSALVGHLQRLHVAHDAHLCENGHMVNEEHDEDNNRRAALQRANARLKMDKDTLLWTLCAQAHGALEEDHGMAHESLQEEMQAILAVLQDNERLTHEVQELRTKMQVQEQVIEERRDAGATPQGGVVQRGSDPAGPTLPQDALQLHALQMENETLKAENERLSSRSTHKVGTGASSVEARTKKGENDSSLRREIACLKDNKAELLRTHNALETAMEEHRMHDMLERTTQEEVLEYKGHRICVLTKQISALKEENKRLTTSSGVDLPWLTEIEEPHNQQCISALRKENDRLRAENEDLAHSHSVVRQAMEEHRVHDVVERVKQEELVVVEQMRITQLTNEIAAVKEEYDGLLKRQEQDVTRDEECIAALRDANARLTTDFSTQLREAHAAMEEYRMEYVVEHEKAACEAEARADALLHKKEVHLAALAADVAQLKEGRATALGREMPQHDGDRTDVVGWWKARDKERMGALQEENGGAVEDNGGLVAERRQSDDEDAQCGTDDAERVTHWRLTTDGAFGHQQERDHAAAELRWDNRHLRRRNSMLVQKLHQNNVGIVGQLLRNSAEYDDEPMKNVDDNDPHFGALMRENTKLQDQNEELERMVQDINVPLAEESQIGDDEDHPELQRVSVLESENTWLRKEAQKWKRELASGRHGAPNGAEGASAQIRVDEEVGGITPLMQEVQAIKDEKEGLEKFVASQRSSVAQQIVAGIEAQKKVKMEERRIAVLTTEVEALKADKEALEQKGEGRSSITQEHLARESQCDEEERRIAVVMEEVEKLRSERDGLVKFVVRQRSSVAQDIVAGIEAQKTVKKEERRMAVLKKEIEALKADKEALTQKLNWKRAEMQEYFELGPVDDAEARDRFEAEERRKTELSQTVAVLSAKKEDLQKTLQLQRTASQEGLVLGVVEDGDTQQLLEEERRRSATLRAEVQALKNENKQFAKTAEHQRSSIAQDIVAGIEAQKKVKREERRIAVLTKEVEALKADKEALEQKGEVRSSITQKHLARESQCDEEERRIAVLMEEVEKLRSEKDGLEKFVVQQRSSVAHEIVAGIEAQKKAKKEERRIAALTKEVEALKADKEALENNLNWQSTAMQEYFSHGTIDDIEARDRFEAEERRITELTKTVVARSAKKEDLEKMLQLQRMASQEPPVHVYVEDTETRTQLEEEERRITVLKKEVHTLTAEKESTENALKQQCSLVARHIADGIDAQTKVKKETRRITALVKEVDALKADKEKLEAEIESHNAAPPEPFVHDAVRDIHSSPMFEEEEEERRIDVLKKEVHALTEDKEGIEKALKQQRSSVAQNIADGIETQKKAKTEERRIAALAKEVEALNADKEALEQKGDGHISIALEDLARESPCDEEESRSAVLTGEVQTLRSEKERFEKSLKQVRSSVAQDIGARIEAQKKMKEEERRIAALIKEVEALTENKDMLEKELERYSVTAHRHVGSGVLDDGEMENTGEGKEHRVNELTREIVLLKEDKEQLLQRQSHSEDEYLANHAQTAWEATQLVTALNLKNKELEVEISELCDIHSAFVAITRDRELKGWLLVHELQHNNDGRDAAIAAAARDRARGEVDNEAQRGITVVMKEEHRKELPQQVEGPMFEQAPSAQDATVCALQEEISGLKLRLRSSEDLYENMAAECARIEARAQQVMQLENTAAVAHATFHKHASKQLNEVLPHATLQQDVVDDYVGRHIEESFPIIACLEQTARAREEGMETLEATKDSVSQPNEESGTRIPVWARDMTDQHATMTRVGESNEVSQRCANESTQRTADDGSLEQQTADRDDAPTTLTEEKTGLERHHNTRSRRLDLLEQQTLHQSEVIAVLDEDKNAYMQRYEARRECVERVEQEALAHRGDTLLVPEEGLAPQRSAPEHASRIGALTHDAAQWTTKSADLRSECNAHLARIRSLEERNTALQAENTAYVAVYPDCMTAQAALDQLRASIQSTTLENNVATQRLEATQAAYKDEEHKIRALCTRLGEDAIGAERHLVRAREQVAREEHALEGVSAQVTEERQARAMCESMVCELRAMVDDEKRALVVAELALQAMNADIEAARRVRGQEETIVRELQNANDDLQSVEGRLRKDEYGLEESVGVLTKALAATNCEIADQRASLDHLRATVRDEEASGAALRASSALLDTTVRASEHHVQELRAQARAAQQCGEREKEKYDALQKCEEGKLATLRHEVVALEQEVEVSRATHEASRATRALAIAELEETEQVHQDTITRLKQQQMALIQDQSLLRTMVAQLRKEEHMCETQIHDVHRAQQCETNEVTAAKHAVAECAAELDAMKHEEISVLDELTTVRAGVARYKQEQHALLDARALLASESAALASEHAHLHEDVARVRAVELPTVQGELRAMHDELATQRLALLHVTREETSAAESLQRLHTNVDALEQHKTALLVAVKGHTQGDALWTPSGMGGSTMHTREDDDVADAKKLGQGRDVHEGTGVGVDEDGHAVVGTWGRDEPFEARRRNEGEIGGLKEEEQWLEDRVRSLRTEEEECQHEVYLRTEEAARESHEMEELSDSIEEMKQEENWRASVLMDLKREELRLCKSVEKLKQEEVRLSTPWASLDTDHTPGVNVAALPISEESSQVAHHDAEGEEGEWRQRALQAADENVSLSTDVAELREQNEKKRNEVNAQAELIESMRLHREHLEREIHLLEQRLHDRGSPSGAPGMPGVLGLGGAPCLASSENGDERAADSGSGDRDGDQGGPQNVEELEKKLRVAEKEVRCEREERRQTDRFYEHLNEKMLKLSSIILVNEQLLDKHQCVVTEDSKRTCDIYKTQAKLARQETR